MRLHVVLFALSALLPAETFTAIDLKPSGGTVGQVCYFETAANGSNKVCLTAPASLSGDVTFKWPTADGSAGEALTTDGAGQLYWSSAGIYWSRTGTNTYLTNAGDSVGINTSTPTYQFTVESATYTSGERFLFGARAADGSVSVVAGYRANGTTGTAGILRSGGNKPLDMGTTGTPQAIRIEDGGNVGIGTTSPSTLLQVNGAVTVTSLALSTALSQGVTTRIDSSGNGNFTSLQIGGGTIITSLSRWGSDLMPSADNAHALGGPSLRWNVAYIDSLYVGACSGCSGGGYLTRTYAQLFPTTAGDDILVKNGGGTQTAMMRASDGAFLGGALYTGGTQRVDSSGNMYTPSITIAGSWAIGAGGTAVLGSVFVADLWQGATSRINSSGVFNAASYNVAGTEVISSGRVFKPVSLDVNGTANVIDSSRNATFVGLTFGASSALVQGSTTRISTGGAATFVGVEIGGSSTLTQGGTSRITAGGVGNFASLQTASSTRIDGSGNFTANSIVFPGGIYQITSSGVALFSSMVSGGPVGASNVNITSSIAGTPSSGFTFYVSGSQVRVRFSDGTDKEVSLL